MKLPWFYHSQLFCNCPRSRSLFGGKPTDCSKVVLTLLLPENRKMAGRFALLDETELKKLTDKCKNRNTTYLTQTWINSHRAWAIERQKNVDLEQYSLLELNRVLCQFYAELRKAGGSEYEPDSLRVMQAALNRYLRENNMENPS